MSEEYIPPNKTIRTILVIGILLAMISAAWPNSVDEVGSYDTSYITDMEAEGDYLYVTTSGKSDSESKLLVLNITDPTAPKRVGSYNVPGSATSLTIVPENLVYNENNIPLLYVTSEDWEEENGGLTWYSPLPPTEDNSGRGLTFRYSSLLNNWLSGYDVVISGNHAYAGGTIGLISLDISDPFSPEEVSVGRDNYGEMTYGSIEDVVVAGEYAYIISYGQLAIVSIKDPERIWVVTSTDEVSAGGVAAHGKYAYVSDWEQGLLVFDISDPKHGEKPEKIGEYRIFFADAEDVMISNEQAYVSCEGILGGVLVMDISEPSEPKVVNRYKAKNAHDVAVHGNYVYVADGTNGLLVFDKSETVAPWWQTPILIVLITGIIISGMNFYDKRKLEININPAIDKLVDKIQKLDNEGINHTISELIEQARVAAKGQEHNDLRKARMLIEKGLVQELAARKRYDDAIQIDRREREEKERLTREKQQQIDRAKEREKALDYDSAIQIWEELGNIEEAARVRKLKSEQDSVKVDQTVVHGDQVTKTEIKDSVVSKSNIGSGGDDKLTKIKELKELLSEGLIDDDEFKQMKKEILGK